MKACCYNCKDYCGIGKLGICLGRSSAHFGRCIPDRLICFEYRYDGSEGKANPEENLCEGCQECKKHIKDGVHFHCQKYDVEMWWEEPKEGGNDDKKRHRRHHQNNLPQ